MACIPAPTVPVPTLPGGISITPPLPGGSFDAAFCCKQINLPLHIPPIPLGVTLNPAIQTAITTTLKAIQDFIDSAVPSCPRE